MYSSILKPALLVGTIKHVMPRGLAVFAAGAREHEIVGGDVQAGIPHLGAGDSPVVAVANAAASPSRSRRSRDWAR